MAKSRFTRATLNLKSSLPSRRCSTCCIGQSENSSTSSSLGCGTKPADSSRSKLKTTSLRRPSDLSQRSEEHTSELQSLMRISYAVFCLTKHIYTLINTDVNH